MTATADTIEILVGVGSNIDPEYHVRTALTALRAHFSPVRHSTFYWTRPLRNRPQHPYLNGVVAAATSVPVHDVLTILADLEQAAGRVRIRGDAYASRTLDLDLLLYGTAAIPELDLPAPDLLERDFVLIPAAELMPDWIHPHVGKPLAHLAATRFPIPVTIIERADLTRCRNRDNAG